jgi:hypothetical protein
LFTRSHAPISRSGAATTASLASQVADHIGGSASCGAVPVRDDLPVLGVLGNCVASGARGWLG